MFIINLKHNVGGLAFGKDKFFVLLFDIMENGNVSFDKQPYNNINAYNYNGKFL